MKPTIARCSNLERLSGVTLEKIYNLLIICVSVGIWPARALHRSPGSRCLSGRFTWSAPRSLQTRQPVGLSPERHDKQPNRQPVAVACARFKPFRTMFQIPAKMLNAPLVRPDLPALIAGFRNGSSTLQMRAHCRLTSSWKSTDQKPLCLMDRLAG